MVKPDRPLNLDKLSHRLRASKRIGVSMTFIDLDDFQKLIDLAEKVELLGALYETRKTDRTTYDDVAAEVIRAGRSLAKGSL
jgi:hypothetical protein